jgi:hypothetical protein
MQGQVLSALTIGVLDGKVQQLTQESRELQLLRLFARIDN